MRAHAQLAVMPMSLEHAPVRDFGKLGNFALAGELQTQPLLGHRLLVLETGVSDLSRGNPHATRQFIDQFMGGHAALLDTQQQVFALP